MQREIIRMKKDRDWIEYDFGADDYAIEFKSAIIDNLAINGINDIDWVEVVDGVIEYDLEQIYNDDIIRMEHRTLIEIMNYYDKICDKVETFIRDYYKVR